MKVELSKNSNGYYMKPIVPSLGEMIDEVLTEMDPEQGVEEAYMKRND